MVSNINTNIEFLKRLRELYANKTLEFMYNLENFFRNSDEDNLHQLRISARKLENIFYTFRVLTKDTEYKIIFNEIKKTVKILSARRELDVCISMTLEYYSTTKANSILLNNFFVFLQRQSRMQNKEISKNKNLRNMYINKNLIEKFVRVNIFSDSEIFSEYDVIQNLLKTVSTHFANLMSYKESVIDTPENIKVLHKMRLAAKPLRYTIETALKYFSMNFSGTAEILKKFVALAGNIHDIDMLMNKIDEYIEFLEKETSIRKKIIHKGSLYNFKTYLSKKRFGYFGTLVLVIKELEKESLKFNPA